MNIISKFFYNKKTNEFNKGFVWAVDKIMRKEQNKEALKRNAITKLLINDTPYDRGIICAAEYAEEIINNAKNEVYDTIYMEK